MILLLKRSFFHLLCGLNHLPCRVIVFSCIFSKLLEQHLNSKLGATSNHHFMFDLPDMHVAFSPLLFMQLVKWLFQSAVVYAQHMCTDACVTSNLGKCSAGLKFLQSHFQESVGEAEKRISANYRFVRGNGLCSSCFVLNEHVTNKKQMFGWKQEFGLLLSSA